MANKTKEYYKHKSIYLDEADEYQLEAKKLLDLCGHKQSKFLGLLVHEFIIRNGIDVKTINKGMFKNYINILEMQVTSGNSMMMIPLNQMMMSMNSMVIPQYQPDIKVKSDKKKTLKGDDFINEEDMSDMNEALAAFGV